MRASTWGFVALVVCGCAVSAAGGSLVGDTIGWDFAVEDEGSFGSGSAIVADPGVEADATIWFAPGSRYEADFTDDSLSLSYDTPKLDRQTIWTFTDLDWSGEPSRISGVTQTGGTAVNDILFSKDAITITVPDVSGIHTFDFDVQHRPLRGLEDDTFHWNLSAIGVGTLGGGSATVEDPGVEVTWTHPQIPSMNCQADFTSDTLTIRYDLSGSSGVNGQTVWTFTDLDFVYPPEAIFDVTQIDGDTVDSIHFTEDSITITFPEIGQSGEYTFQVTPVPEPASLAYVAVLAGCGFVARRRAR